MKIALFNLGFRPFFLVAGIYSVVVTVIWLLVYATGYQLPIAVIPNFQWHAHEMVFGYSLAVVAGFLLTAAKNWTGVQTVNGKPLMLLVLLWLMARVLLFYNLILSACVVDILFNLGLAGSLFYPIYQVKQWRQKGILLILFLFAGFNLLFYLGVLQLFNYGIYLGIYGGLYLLLVLLFIMSRRVVPMFTQNGVDIEIQLKNYVLVDRLIIPLLLVFIVLDLLKFAELTTIQAYIALVLFALNAIRLFAWYTSAIWKKTLLWSLHLSLWSICVGFLLFYCSYAFGISRHLAIHAFVYGGIGAITLAMMSRVAYGHTGRNLQKPPKAMGWAFAFMVLGTITRVLLPIIIPQYYVNLIIVSQVLWIMAFVVFVLVYAPILIKPRVDGRAG